MSSPNEYEGPEDFQEDEKPPKIEYRGNKIPFLLKLAWSMLILWGVYYSWKYAVPNLQDWLNK